MSFLIFTFGFGFGMVFYAFLKKFFLFLKNKAEKKSSSKSKVSFNNFFENWRAGDEIWIKSSQIFNKNSVLKLDSFSNSKNIFILIDSDKKNTRELFQIMEQGHEGDFYKVKGLSYTYQVDLWVQNLSLKKREELECIKQIQTEYHSYEEIQSLIDSEMNNLSNLDRTEKTL